MGYFPPRLLNRILEPFRINRAPARELAWGAALGILTSLLPLFGIQLYVAIALWAAGRWLTGFTFNLPMCFAVSWVMNPITVIPIYYAYLVTGDLLLRVIGEPGAGWTFPQFSDAFVAATTPTGDPWWEGMLRGLLVILDYFGPPILIGSVVWAFPAAAAAWVLTRWIAVRTQRRKGTFGTMKPAPEANPSSTHST